MACLKCAAFRVALLLGGLEKDPNVKYLDKYIVMLLDHLRYSQSWNISEEEMHFNLLSFITIENYLCKVMYTFSKR